MTLASRRPTTSCFSPSLFAALLCVGCAASSSTSDELGARGSGGSQAVAGASQGGAPSGGTASGGMPQGGTAQAGASQGGTSGGSGTGGTGTVHTGPWSIMALGDSITASTCWRARLWDKLNQTHASDFELVGTLSTGPGCTPSDYDKDNQGYGSALVTEIANNVTDKRSCQPYCPSLSDLSQAFTSELPDVILMHFGTNDVWNGIAPSTILSAYSAVVGAARAANPDVHFFVAQIIPMNPSGCSACGGRVEALNAEIPAWATGEATAASPIEVVDQWTGYDVNDDNRDGVHPNDSGSQKMADRWAAALEPLF